MSPFGKKNDDQDDAADSNRQLNAEVERLGALSLPQLATEVMTKGFGPEYDPSRGGSPIASIAEEFSPRPPANIRDTTIRAQKRKAASSDPASAASRLLLLQDLVAEGVQVLDKAGLVRLKTGYQGSFFNAGYTTTRLGRAALERNAVDRVLGGGTL